jgi:hypothetical protein
MRDLPKIVIDRLPAAAAADPHPEPNLLAAFAERTLAKSEREQVMAHLARCGVCRKITTLASPLDETANLPLRVRSGWLTWPSFRWAFAGIGTVAVLAVALVRFEQRQAGQSAVSLPPQMQIQESSKQAISSSSGVSESTPSQSAVKPQTRGREGDLSESLTGPDGQGTAAPSDGNTAPQYNVQNQATASASNQTSDPLVQSRTSSPSPYQNFDSADVVKAKPAVAGQAEAGSQPMPALPLQTSPSLMMRASPRWTVTAHGGLQRSFDAGKTWEDVGVTETNEQIQPKPVFQVVEAIGPEVWAGGPAAVLYHSVDSGNHWQQVHPSSGAIALTGDISRIEFLDPQNGKVATSTGEAWFTSDNGQTWKKSQ